MSQTDIFLEGEGDAWFARNRDKLGHHDPVTDMIKSLELQPKSVLEIGCANGWRLLKLRAMYGCDVYGLEPSAEAVRDANSSHLPGVSVGDACDIGMFIRESFDIVIFGFCLYLCEPKDLFRIVAESDRVLKDGGTLIIHDFRPPVFNHARKYHHREGVLSYHVDFAKLWLAHPWYHQAGAALQDNEVVIPLKKITAIEVAP